MFPRNCWYVAAEAEEIGRAPLGRVLLGERVALWRGAQGQPIAFEDRCPHRRMPLSRGRPVGDRLHCRYHGLAFDPSGACVGAADGSAVPPGARVRVYPVVERYRWIWVWMGDPAAADDSAIVPFPWRESEAWGDKGARFHVEADYRLLIDNLLDQSHLAYVHATTIGDAAIAEHADTRIFKRGDAVTAARWTVGHPAPPTYRKMMGWTEDDLVDRWAINEFRPPGAVRLLVGAAPGAAGGRTFGFAELDHPVPANGFAFRNLNFITPETEASCHYFWSNACNLAPITEERTNMQFEQILRAFRQDWEVLEMQQRNRDRRPTVDTRVDAGRIAARRVIDGLIAAEARANGRRGRIRTAASPRPS